MSNKLVDMMQTFCQEQNKIGEAAYSLWSWLPSHAAAVALYEDNYHHYQPDPADLLSEATMVMAQMWGFKISKAEAVEWFFIGNDLLEDREEPSPYDTDDKKLAFIKGWFKNSLNKNLLLDGEES